MSSNPSPIPQALGVSPNHYHFPLTRLLFTGSRELEITWVNIRGNHSLPVAILKVIGLAIPSIFTVIADLFYMTAQRLFGTPAITASPAHQAQIKPQQKGEEQLLAQKTQLRKTYTKIAGVRFTTSLEISSFVDVFLLLHPIGYGLDTQYENTPFSDAFQEGFIALQQQSSLSPKELAHTLLLCASEKNAGLNPDEMVSVTISIISEANDNPETVNQQFPRSYLIGEVLNKTKTFFPLAQYSDPNFTIFSPFSNLASLASKSKEVSIWVNKEFYSTSNNGHHSTDLSLQALFNEINERDLQEFKTKFKENKDYKYCIQELYRFRMRTSNEEAAEEREERRKKATEDFRRDQQEWQKTRQKIEPTKQTG